MEKKIFNDTLGEMNYNSDLSWYEGTIDWCGDSVGFSITADNEDELNDIINTAVEIMKNMAEWDTTVRKFAAKVLTELANDWAYDIYDWDKENGEEDDENEPPEITEEEFARRIDLCDISFYDNGEFTFWFYDDEMFLGHSVTVYGNIKNGCTDAQIEG